MKAGFASSVGLCSLFDVAMFEPVSNLATRGVCFDCVVAPYLTSASRDHPILKALAPSPPFVLLCLETSAAIPQHEPGTSSVGLSVQFVEIYNDKIRDLLHPGADSSAFRVREHPQTGPYIDNLVPVQVCMCSRTRGKMNLLPWWLVIL